MTLAAFVRWSGIALIAGGICLALFGLTFPINSSGFPDNDNRGAQWVVSHTFHFVGATLIQFGLFGIMARQIQRNSRLDIVAFLVAFWGTLMFACLGIIAGYLSPLYPLLLSDRDPLNSNPLGLVFPASGLLFIAGWILVAIAIVRAGVPPKWSAVLIIVGAGPFALGFLFPWVVGAGAGLVFGAGLVWLGYAMWSGRQTAVALAGSG